MDVKMSGSNSPLKATRVKFEFECERSVRSILPLEARGGRAIYESAVCTTVVSKRECVSTQVRSYCKRGRGGGRFFQAPNAGGVARGESVYARRVLTTEVPIGSEQSGLAKASCVEKTRLSWIEHRSNRIGSVRLGEGGSAGGGEARQQRSERESHGSAGSSSNGSEPVVLPQKTAAGHFVARHEIMHRREASAREKRS